MAMTCQRYGALDFLRGLTLVSMVLYHAGWDFVHLFGMDWPWFRGSAAYLWQQSICWTFILLSGFCTALGRKNLRRGVQVLAAGLLVSAVTVLFVPEDAIVFGVLTLLGVCMLLAALGEPVLARISPWVGLPASLLLFVFTRNINDGFLGFGPWNLAALPQGLYRNLLTAFLGFPTVEFHSPDYFSLFPWGFLFFAGLFASRLCQEKGVLPHLCFRRAAPLQVLGRYSLPIYLLHQPVLYLCLSLVF